MPLLCQIVLLFLSNLVSNLGEKMMIKALFLVICSVSRTLFTLFFKYPYNDDFDFRFFKGLEKNTKKLTETKSKTEYKAFF